MGTTARWKAGDRGGVKRGRWGGGDFSKEIFPEIKDKKKKKKAGVSQNVECGVEIKNGGAAVE